MCQNKFIGVSSSQNNITALGHLWRSLVKSTHTNMVAAGVTSAGLRSNYSLSPHFRQITLILINSSRMKTVGASFAFSTIDLGKHLIWSELFKALDASAAGGQHTKEEAFVSWPFLF
jgi:hypothetical protein